MFCSAFWCSCFPSVRASGVRHLFFFPYFALSNLQLLRAFVDLRVVFFVPSGFRAFGVHGFRVFGLRVFMFLVVVLPSCKLSGFLPLMFSSFRLSFPFSGIVNCLFEIRFREFFFRCCLPFCLFFGNSEQAFLPVQQPFLPVQQSFFPMSTTIFEIVPFMFAFVDVCLSRAEFCFADSAPKSQGKTLAWLSLRWAQWPCLEVLARLQA